jgi:predicted acylesterase/phospholipase RssA
MPRRSLMLAGGGVKIAFQAGVLQVWLDEAGLQFDHGDGASAACFNLAMWAQGMSGTRIADNWRRFRPISAVRVNWAQLLRPGRAASLLKLDAFRSKVFPAWGLDFAAIRAGGRQATFNVYNFSRYELRPVPAEEMSEDLLVAAASLPVWFPPVRLGGEALIDAVFNTASNLEEAIRRGADELWVVWTTGQTGRWREGLVGNFFGIFEATTNDAYKRMLARIARNNEAVAAGGAGEFGRPILVRELKAEVPLPYLLNFSRKRNRAAVELGVQAARAWCRTNGITLRAPAPASADLDHV